MYFKEHDFADPKIAKIWLNCKYLIARWTFLPPNILFNFSFPNV